MTDDQLAQRIAQAREYERTIKAMTFRLRIPTRNEMRVMWAEARDGGGDAALRIAASFTILRTSLLSVRGATTADLKLPGDVEPLPSTLASALALVDHRDDLAMELNDELLEKMRVRNEELEADEKN